jgi:glucose-6-phosphate-specific signal transduction histidine kinase
MMRRLRPSTLDDLGLEATLQSCISAAKLNDRGVECHHTFSGRLDTLGELINITLYRVLQEALTNVAKHAHANNVWIEVIRDENIGPDKSGDVVRMRVCDDGQGMDVEAKTRRFGLIGLRERLRAVNGTFQMESEQGKGTFVTVAIPVQGKAIGEVS